VPGIVAQSAYTQGQEQEEPEEASFSALVVGIWSIVGRGRIFFQGSRHPVPIGTVCPQRVFFGRPPEKIIKVGVL
jgi:hypothetical protein